MAFNPGGTDYGGFQRSRDRADEGLTRAQDSAGRAAKQARIKKSGERSGMQKLLSTAARGAAAYYTGGLSEQMGGGEMIDQAMLGTDSQGNAVRNEYGGLVKLGSGIYQGMDARKKADIAKKRALNLQKFNQKKDLATEVGKLDKDQGIKMMVEADALRKVQENQTAAADDKGIWGWDNKFDDLEKTPSQIAGQKIAQEKQALDLSSEARRQGGQLDSQKALEDERMSIREGASGRGYKTNAAREEDRTSARESASRRGMEGLARQSVGRKEAGRFARQGVLDEQSRIGRAEDIMNAQESAREDASRRGYKSTDSILDDAEKGMSVGKIEEDKMWKRLSNEDDIDREYDKRLVTGSGREATGKTKDEYVADYLGGGQKNRQVLYAGDWLSGRDQFKGSPISKTYLEEKPKEDDYRSAMDKMADESDRIKRVQEAKGGWGGYKPDWARGKDERQLLLEDRLQKEEALRREHARTGGPSGRADYEGSLYRPMKSKLRKKMEARRQKAKEVALRRGGILAGGSAQ